MLGCGFPGIDHAQPPIQSAARFDARVLPVRRGRPWPETAMTTYSFSADERPSSAGSPYTPKLSVPRKLAYALVGTFIGLISTFPNALVNANLGNIAGSMGLYVAEASWLPALYFGMNASSNLTLVKARAQFGIPLVTQTLLALYAGVAVLQLMFPSFAMAVAARIANGIETGALVSLSVYYFLMVFPGKLRPLALLMGVSLTQFGTPLARLIPIELLRLDSWRGLHCLELAVPLLILAAILAVPLPPTDRTKAFEPKDLLSIALLVPGVVLGCEVLGLGRVLWWSDTHWLGWLFAASVALVGLGCVVEAHRARPLLDLRWLSTINIARFVGIALLMRLALAEQTFGSVGLLTTAGLSNDQLHILFALVAGSMGLGILAAALTLKEERLAYQVVAAALCVAVGALLDSHSNNLTRPEQLYLSQSLIGFGTTLFIGPAILYGVIQMLRSGGERLITIVVLFSITQNVGALAGSALMGTFQTERVNYHANALAAHLDAQDPQVASRIAAGSAAVSKVVVDPALRAAEGGAQLGRAATEEATVLAFNDVFGFLARLSGATALFVALSLFLKRLRHSAPNEAHP